MWSSQAWKRGYAALCPAAGSWGWRATEKPRFGSCRSGFSSSIGQLLMGDWDMVLILIQSPGFASHNGALGGVIHTGVAFAWGLSPCITY